MASGGESPLKPAQGTHSKESIASTSPPRFHFADLPPGIIHFTASPKLAVNHKRTANVKSRTARRTPTKVDVDGLSGMLTKLSFRKKKDSAASKREKAQQKSKSRNLLQARIRGDATPKYFEGVVSGFEPWVGCRREPFLARQFHETPTCEVRLQNMSFMSTYQNVSSEELRVQDYLSGRKGPVSKAHYGPSFTPMPGTDTIARGRDTPNVHTFTIDTKHHCITAMQEYSNESFEELRLEHYMPSLGWKDRETFSLPLKEMQKLQIALDSDVYVYLDSARKRGKVRFIGQLPAQPQSKKYVGIELDEPYGDGHGYYKGRKLFRTRHHRARIAPLSAALPAYLVSEDGGETSISRDKLESENDDDSAHSSTKFSDSKGNQCSVCLSNDVEMFFQPCGHVCCCSSCSKQVKECPICRKRIQAKHRAYLT